MHMSSIELPVEMIDILSAIYNRARKTNPELTESIFMQRIVDDWLKGYSRETTLTTKKNVVLQNRIKKAIEVNKKNITEVARTIGIDRVHLSNIINRKSEPSVTIALLLEEALDSQLQYLFFLEQATQD